MSGRSVVQRHGALCPAGPYFRDTGRSVRPVCSSETRDSLSGWSIFQRHGALCPAGPYFRDTGRSVRSVRSSETRVALSAMCSVACSDRGRGHLRPAPRHRLLVRLLGHPLVRPLGRLLLCSLVFRPAHCVNVCGCGGIRALKTPCNVRPTRPNSAGSLH